MDMINYTGNRTDRPAQELSRTGDATITAVDGIGLTIAPAVVAFLGPQRRWQTTPSTWCWA